MRILAVFEKSERIRHIGHLDIQRSMQRGLRRSGLPVAYSNGFNPHILITFASALSTGACGQREIMDVTMAEPTDAAVFLEKMNQAMPPELHLKEARAVDDRHPALMGSLRAASYDLLVYDPQDARLLIRAIPHMMDQSGIGKNTFVTLINPIGFPSRFIIVIVLLGVCETSIHKESVIFLIFYLVVVIPKA